MIRFLAIALLSGCASKSLERPLLPPLPPMAMATIKHSLTVQPSASETIVVPPQTLFLRWDYKADATGIAFRIYARDTFADLWSLIATTTNTEFQVTTDGGSRFFTVSAFGDGAEAFATK